MRAIRSQGSGIERIFKRRLRKFGYKFQTNLSKLPGKPDIVFKGKKIAIFIDSCFWHGCRKHLRLPGANSEYWKAKINKNKLRDRKVNKIYKDTNWLILRFWEHDINKDLDKCVNKVTKVLEIKRSSLRYKK